MAAFLKKNRKLLFDNVEKHRRTKGYCCCNRPWAGNDT